MAQRPPYLTKVKTEELINRGWMSMTLVEKYGPWALVVGGSEGVGAAFAAQLAQAGFHLVLSGHESPSLVQTASAIVEDTGAKVRTVTHDLCIDDPLQPIRRATDDLEIGLLIYTVGSVVPAPSFVDAPLELGLRAMRLNALGQTSFAHHFGGRMKSRGRGGIIMIGSNGGICGIGGLACYAAAKAYTQIFAEGLWAELKPFGVDVLCAVLGPTRTPFLGRLGVPIDDPAFAGAWPADTAAVALESLGNGPVVYPGGSDDVVQATAGLSRADAVQWATERVRAMSVGT
ncbi:SDR family NAD(P)-dependent oxidoreductase [Novosphingobium sp. PASSN1]|uniref:SDR family NAD(P)-dependent oxidoreductase n=1 Tax=Novosphingobium sp. PASSN1 TaxID=2015561 RepID=UPI000BCA6FE6|nr:SDR family NAD(P)-dependent oxidoreductase [Novosphingobium sp. PASSN1]OYU34793.1 MAG: short-chain dehydrogenase [Novosphingobium sp. PASSN1]